MEEGWPVWAEKSKWRLFPTRAMQSHGTSTSGGTVEAGIAWHRSNPAKWFERAEGRVPLANTQSVIVAMTLQSSEALQISSEPPESPRSGMLPAMSCAPWCHPWQEARTLSNSDLALYSSSDCWHTCLRQILFTEQECDASWTFALDVKGSWTFNVPRENVRTLTTKNGHDGCLRIYWIGLNMGAYTLVGYCLCPLFFVHCV